MVRFTEKEFISILNRRKFIDSWFWERYGINTYNGCQFGCVYCDSRSQKYHLPQDFENDIIIKKDAAKLLDRRLTNARTLLPDVVGFSGATDPYQPAEARFKNTLQCLEVLKKHKYPVHIITKSKLILRDLDLIEDIGNETWACISLTITTTNPDIARFLEEKVPSPKVRFEIIKTIKEKTKHIQAGVLFIPVVPYLCDRDETLEDMVKQTKVCSGDYILFGGGMTMRDLQALWFLKHLKERYPELIDKYEELYKFKYNPDSYQGSYEPKRNYAIKIHKKLFELCERYNLAYRIKRFIPDDFRQKNYIIAEKLLNKAYESQMRGKAWSNLHWAGQNIQNLKTSIVEVEKRGELQGIRNVNEEIESFIKENL
jgi:DNA repair photolyase